MSRDGDGIEADFRVVALDGRRELASGEAYDDEVRERCRQIWSTFAGASAARTVRWYARHAEPGTPVPSERTVKRWAADDRWRERRVEDFARYHGQSYFELQMAWYAAQVGAVQDVLDVQAGLYDDEPMVGALHLKAAELPGRMAERNVVPFMPAAPAQDSTDWDSLSLEEREALMRETLQKRKQAGHG